MAKTVADAGVAEVFGPRNTFEGGAKVKDLGVRGARHQYAKSGVGVGRGGGARAMDHPNTTQDGTYGR